MFFERFKIICVGDSVIPMSFWIKKIQCLPGMASLVIFKCSSVVVTLLYPTTSVKSMWLLREQFGEDQNDYV